MIDSDRICRLNDSETALGRYVLYWMQAAQRAEFNHALEYAAQHANQLNRPLVVAFALTPDYPDANQRHYAFMLQGLRETATTLRNRGIQLVIRIGSPDRVAIELAADASLVVCDRGYLRHQKRWRDSVADHARRHVVQVESDVVVPVESASTRQEYAARTIRPKIHRLFDQFLTPHPITPLRRDSLNLRIGGDIDLNQLPQALSAIKIDHTVRPSPHFTGGTTEARRRLTQFLRDGLPGYSQGRNAPGQSATSTLSPYLHFGQISPIEVALAVQQAHAPTPDREAFLEQLIVRRELAVNFVNYCPNYDAFDAIPDWARRTLRLHQSDKRQYVYARHDLEAANTHDPYWNAAQTEMVATGYMHGYMRMYWGKKILEWKPSPQEAHADLLYLNNKYFLCGRDPNAYTNVAWIFGLHDRPWAQRNIFGTVRYMNAQGLDRKFDMAAYLRMVQTVASSNWTPPRQ